MCLRESLLSALKMYEISQICFKFFFSISNFKRLSDDSNDSNHFKRLELLQGEKNFGDSFCWISSASRIPRIVWLPSANSGSFLRSADDHLNQATTQSICGDESLNPHRLSRPNPDLDPTKSTRCADRQKIASNKTHPDEFGASQLLISSIGRRKCSRDT